MTGPKDFAALECESGVSIFDGLPFIRISAEASDGTTIVGQVRPNVARDLALQLLEAAEASIADAVVRRLLVNTLGVGDQQAAIVIGSLREIRASVERDALDTGHDLDDDPGGG